MFLAGQFTWSEVPMDAPGLLMHFLKHLSVTFCNFRTIVDQISSKNCVFLSSYGEELLHVGEGDLGLDGPHDLVLLRPGHVTHLAHVHLDKIL